mgnify:FL=1|jgi:hypothetical protein
MGVPDLQFDGALISGAVGLLTSLLLAYVPGLNAWWETFTHKREALAGVGLILAVAMAGLHYAGAINLGLGPFGWPVIWQVLGAWWMFAGAGQLAYTAQQSVIKQ